MAYSRDAQPSGRDKTVELTNNRVHDLKCIADHRHPKTHYKGVVGLAVRRRCVGAFVSPSTAKSLGSELSELGSELSSL
jgi:hypothetical protein